MGRVGGTGARAHVANKGAHMAYTGASINSAHATTTLNMADTAARMWLTRGVAQNWCSRPHSLEVYSPARTVRPLNLKPYRGTSLTKKRTPLGPYGRPMPRVLVGSWGGGRFLMGEVPL